MPVKNIEVMSDNYTLAGTRYSGKEARWQFPYKRLQPGFSYINCTGVGIIETAEQWYEEARSVILNGTRRKDVYDCNRGIVGIFVDEKDDISKAQMFPVRGGFVRYYLALCSKVNGEMPYLPEKVE
jgi:hypothetical protein